MTNIYKGLCWATAILLTAIGNYYGLIDDETAQTLFVVLPIVAVTSLRNACGCSLARARKTA